MGFDFSSKKTRASRVQTSDYASRAKQEQKRFRLATCTAFYVMVCFATEDDLRAFQDKLGDSRKYIPGRDVEDKIAAFPTHNRDWRTKTVGGVAPDPLANVEYTDGLEVDCKRELVALQSAFGSVDMRPDRAAHVADSPYWFVIVCKDDDDMLRFLTEYKLLRYGDKYLDGSKWLHDIS